MEQTKLKIDILPNQFLKKDGTFDKVQALKLCGKIAGICYDEEGFKHLEKEPTLKTLKRVNMTVNNGHHSVYDHIYVNLNIQNIPKILAMIINNEHQYTTSEKSARYTIIKKKKNPAITKKEERLYNKWMGTFKFRIKAKYGNIYNDNKIQKLAQENARYLVTVFNSAQMIYTTSLRQINYLVSWMMEYIKNNKLNTEFDKKLKSAMTDFCIEVWEKNLLVEGLMRNEKNRGFSLFGQNLESEEQHFGNVYSCTYKGSLAYLAQAQRHRTLDYQMEWLNEKEYFIPPIIKDDDDLVGEWLYDMHTVKDVIPQGQLVKISEKGKYEDFILKCKERLCTAAQLEIMNQTKNILEQYKNELEKNNNELYNDILKYTNGARCTFPDFTCTSDCKFKEGKTLVRKI